MIVWTDCDGKTLEPGDWVEWRYGGEDKRDVRQVATEAEYEAENSDWRTDKNEWVPVWEHNGNGGPKYVDGWSPEATRRVEPYTFNKINVGDRVEFTLDRDVHRVLVVDYYTDDVDGIVIQSRHGSFAEREGWDIRKLDSSPQE